MVSRKRKPRMPRLALLDSTKIGELCKAIDSMDELVKSMRAAIPALIELTNVSRELMTLTSKLHSANEQAQVHAQLEAARRSEAARKAADTRRRNKSDNGSVINSEKKSSSAQGASQAVASTLDQSDFDGDGKGEEVT